MLMLFQELHNDKDITNLKRVITKDKALYADILRIRKTLNNPAYRTQSKRILGIEQQAIDDGKTKTPTNSELLAMYKERVLAGTETENAATEQVLKRLKMRSNSGVAVISLLTKPYHCPGRCIYCPTEKNMPKSYLSREPAAARALANRFDPYKQIWSRLKALAMNGHPIEKIEMIFIGGTWDYYPREYQEWFTAESFRACNNWGRPESEYIKENEKSLLELHTINTDATARIIGLSIETRPDYVNFSQLNWLRYLGVTKVEIGVQHLDNHVLEYNKREMTAEDCATATETLRRAGFKLVYHMMPNLPESDEEKDIQMFRDLFNGEHHHPDMMKIYPCMILKGSVLYKWWSRGDITYVPYDDEKLTRVLALCEREIPEYVRLIRVIRDIPADYIYASSRKSNLREVVDGVQKEFGYAQRDIRAREIKDLEVVLEDFHLDTVIYNTETGTEHFIQFINKERKIAGFVRLRLPKKGSTTGFEQFPNLEVLIDAAIVRELHVYGTIRRIGQEGNQAQHIGFGKMLMAEAERQARVAGFTSVAVIAGVGVRGYYAKIGYELVGTYMVKTV
jgi:elongator complex protein 3